MQRLEKCNYGLCLIILAVIDNFCWHLYLSEPLKILGLHEWCPETNSDLIKVHHLLHVIVI